MTFVQSKSFWRILAATLVVLGLAACMDQKGSSHQKQVNAANTRWLSMRSGMMLQMAQQQFDTGDLDQAEKTLTDAISLDAKNPRLFILAGRIALERGQLERAYQRLDTSIQLNPKIAEAHYFQGIVLQRWQRYGDALEAYRRAYALQADSPAFLLAISEMLTVTDRTEEAIALLTEKVTYFDQNAGVRAALGQLHMMRKQYDKAVDYYRQAALLKPDDLRLVEGLAAAQLEAGRTTEAIAGYERLCADKSRANRRDLPLALARAYEQAGRSGDARTIYVKLTRLDPADAEPWLKLGQLAWAQGDTGGALLAAKEATGRAPKNPAGYLLAGLIWQKRGNLEEALRNFDRAAELAPQNNEAVILRGITLQRAGRSAAASAAYAEAVRRVPTDARAQELLASVTEEK